MLTNLLDIVTTHSGNAANHSRPLAEDARLHWDANACLQVRYPGRGCDACESACPVDVIGIRAGAPVLDGECIGCGRCAAVCPTAALHTDGFSLPRHHPPGAGTIRVDCWRVPPPESPPGALRVPCLFGISAGWLAALFELGATPDERPIQLLDRGGCHNCPAAAGRNTADGTLAKVRAWLSESGVPAAVLPARVSLPSGRPLSPAIPTAANALPMGRRGFLRELAGSVARTVDQITIDTAARDPVNLRHTLDPIDQLRLATALYRIAARHGRSIPTSALPRLALDAVRCSACGVCASVCPTAALRRRQGADGALLYFEASRCIACGHCADTCPDLAIRVTNTGGKALAVTLARWTAHRCAECGESYFGTAASLCSGCLKKEHLRQGMAGLFPSFV